MRKQFDLAIYNETDAIARSRVRAYVQEVSGLFAKDNPDQYGPDIITYKGLKSAYYTEVEVKLVWTPHSKGVGKELGDFPWKQINLPERKVKFLKLGLPIEFWILRSDLKMAVVIPGQVVDMAPSEEVPNKYISTGEFFRKIEIADCNLVNLQEE